MNSILSLMNPSIHSTSPSSARYAAIPESTMTSLMLYVNEGVPTGSFLRAVLSNDLFGTFERADQENRDAMGLLVTYIYNEIPSLCWGTPRVVSEWVERKRAERESRAQASEKPTTIRFTAPCSLVFENAADSNEEVERRFAKDELLILAGPPVRVDWADLFLPEGKDGARWVARGVDSDAFEVVS